MRRRCAVIIMAWLTCTVGHGAGVAPPSAAGAPAMYRGDGLTLRQALALALERHPELKAFAWHIRAAEARHLQAGLWPNPELSLEVEGMRWRAGPESRTRTARLGGPPERGLAGPLGEFEMEIEEGADSGLRESTFTLRLDQVIELGGKRAERIRLAAGDVETVRWDYEVARARLLTEVGKAFVEALAAQERLAIRRELAALATEVRDSTAARVEAGQIAALELRKAEIERSSARIAVQRAERDLEAARARLASTWGDTEAAFGRVFGRLEAPEPLSPLEVLKERTAGNPDLARWVSEVARRRAAVGLEKARRVPDLTVSLGLQAQPLRGHDVRSYGFGPEGPFFSRSRSSFEDGWDASLVLELSLPLPLFNRNQGSIRAAEHVATAAGEERRAAEVTVLAALTAWYHAAMAAYEAFGALDADMLPNAARTFELTQRGFRQGKFSYLEVLDAQRTLFEVRTQLLEAQAEFQQGVMEVERLLGESAQGREADISASKQEE